MVDEPDVVRLSCAFRSSIGPFFRIACSRLSSVALTSCTSSAEQPVDVSYNIDELSQAAGLARKKNVFYKEVHHSVFKVCDATFLRGSGDGNLATCEQFFFHSDMLDIVFAFRDSKTSSRLSDSRDTRLRQVDSSHRYILYYPRGSKLMNGFSEGLYRSCRS